MMFQHRDEGVDAGLFKQLFHSNDELNLIIFRSILDFFHMNSAVPLDQNLAKTFFKEV